MLIDMMIVLVVALLLFWAIRSVWRNQKKGGCSGCSVCGLKDACPSQKKNRKSTSTR